MICEARLQCGSHAQGLVNPAEVIGNTLYVHLVEEPETAAVCLHPIATVPRCATLLNTGERMEYDVLLLPRFAHAPVNRSLRLKNLPVSGGAAGLVVKLELEPGLAE